MITRNMRGIALALTLGLSAGGLALADPVCVAAPVRLRVTLDAAVQGPVSGRLLVFAKPLEDAKAEAKGGPVTVVDTGEINPRETTVAALEVRDLAAGAGLDVDVDLDAFPVAFSSLAPGRYAVQAVLDTRHSYAYSGRGPGDIVGPVAEMDLPAGGALTLDHLVPGKDPWSVRPDATQARKDEVAHARAATQSIDFVSPALSRFWGRPIHMRGWVLTPPGYADASGARFPTVYFTHGFGGDTDRLVGAVEGLDLAMTTGRAPPMIWVVLDESSATGTHEFADSVNNGPWGEALTTELIPDLEKRYRMDAVPSGRFLQGHSSGGWATLWLQTRYPKLFGGTWSTSPDPSDFHDFTGVDLYAPGANMYLKPDGSPRPLVRDHAKVLATLQDFAQLEAVLGDYGGQMTSFDWVFSPRDQGGRPKPMFDRVTGVVDPEVVAYWRDHYDIAHRLAGNWPALKPDLDGKIHLIVGTADTFYLDGSAHRLKAVLDGLGAKSDFRFLPDRTHFDLYGVGTDRQGLFDQIGAEMYAVARPGVDWKKK